jgi:CBS domain-containing protein
MATIPAPLVREVMSTILVTLSEEDNLEGVNKAMQAYQFRHVPVVDGTKLVGMVTQASLLQFSMGMLRDSGAAQSVRHSFEQRTFVAEIMTKHPASVKPDATLSEAAQLLVDTKAGALPVVDDEGNLIGIVSEIDVLKAAVPFL